MLRKPTITLSLLAFFSVPALASPDKYDFDKDHTHVIFFINHEGFSDMIGRVKDFDGYFTFDEKEPEQSEVDVTLKVASIDTDVPELNKALQSDKFFNAAKFPTMHFKSVRIVPTPPISYKKCMGPQCLYRYGDVIGNLTLLNVTKPVTLHVRYNKSGIHPFTNNYVSGFSADATIKRSDFGMNAYLHDVGDEVHIHIEAEGTDPLKHPGNAKTPH